MGTLDYVAPEQIRGDDGRRPRRRLRARLPPLRGAHRDAPVHRRVRRRGRLRAPRGGAAARERAPRRSCPARRRRPRARDGEGSRPTAGDLRRARRRGTRRRSGSTPAPRRAARRARASPCRRARRRRRAAVVLLATGGGAAAPAPAGSIVRIDPATNAVTARYPARRPSGQRRRRPRAASGSARLRDGSLWRLDPARGDVAALHDDRRAARSDAACGAASTSASDGETLFDGTVVPLRRGHGSARRASRCSRAPSPPATASALGRRVPVHRAASPTDRPARDAPCRASDPVPDAATAETNRFCQCDMAIGEGALWVLGDAVDRRVLAASTSAAAGSCGHARLPFAPRSIAAGEGGVWVTGPIDDVVARDRPATRPGHRADHPRRPRRRAAWRSARAACGSRARSTARSSRIDPAPGESSQTIHVDGSPREVAVGDGAVWVTADARVELVRVAGRRARRASLAVAAAAAGERPVRIGVLTDCQGPFRRASRSRARRRGAAVPPRGARLVGTAPDGRASRAPRSRGRPVELVRGLHRDGRAHRLIEEARRLVESEHVDVVDRPSRRGDGRSRRDAGAPLSGRAVRERRSGTSRSHASRSARRTSSASRPTTRRRVAGLGAYAYRHLGWRTRRRRRRRYPTGLGARRPASWPSSARWAARVTDAATRSPYVLHAGAAAQALRRRGRRRGGALDRLRRPAPASWRVSAAARRRPVAALVLGGRTFGIRRSSATAAVEARRGRRARPRCRRRRPPAGSAPIGGATRRRSRAFPPAVARPVVGDRLLRRGRRRSLTALERVGGDLSDGRRRLRRGSGALRLDLPAARSASTRNRQAVATATARGSRRHRAASRRWSPFGGRRGVEQTFGGLLSAAPPPSPASQPCVGRRRHPGRGERVSRRSSR